MNDRILLALVALIPGIIMIVIGILMLRSDKNRKLNCTERTQGTVIRHSANNWASPIVEYYVNNIRYTRSLTYSSVIKISSSFHKRNYHEIDVTATHLNLRNCNIFYLMREAFPKGSILDVYYNPANSKVSYVMRYAKNNTGYIIFWCGVGIAILFAILSLILPIN